MAKKQARNDRKAVAEKLRKEQQRKERLRSWGILGVCVVIALALVGVVVFKYVGDRREQNRLDALALAKTGASSQAAGCAPVVTKDATGSGQHVNPGTNVPYDSNPPAFGTHWANFLAGSELRTFYTTSDRPEVPRLVHSLEHGHTVLWYDDTVKAGSQAYGEVKAIAAKYTLDSYLIVAPWKSSDGGPFPGGKHLALTHWTGPAKQKGVWQYCSKPSGQVVKSFMDTYPKADAPEPNAA